MLHHLLFLPFFIIFHVAGIVLLLVAGAVLLKAFRRYRPGSGRRDLAMSKDGHMRRSRNEAFDEYRRATLKKLESEAEEFRKYLDGLRRAADAAAFETFLKSRRSEAGPAT